MRLRRALLWSHCHPWLTVMIQIMMTVIMLAVITVGMAVWSRWAGPAMLDILDSGQAVEQSA